MVTLWPRTANVFAATRPATPAPIMQIVFCLTIDYPPCSNSAERIGPAAIAAVRSSCVHAAARGHDRRAESAIPDARRWRLQAENSLPALPRGELFQPHPS